MSFFKRISATVTANLDRAVSQIENHDAVAEAALEEVRDAAARLKVQTGRASAESVRLERQDAEMQAEEAKWTERARKLAAEDETRALACLSRRQQIRDARSALAVRIERQRELTLRLERDLHKVDARLGDLDARRQALRGRELSARGSQAVADLKAPAGINVDGLLERWEVEVTRSELSAEASGEVAGADVDGFAADFEQAERDADLRAELAALVSQQEEKS